MKLINYRLSCDQVQESKLPVRAYTSSTQVRPVPDLRLGRTNIACLSIYSPAGARDNSQARQVFWRERVMSGMGIGR